MKSRLFDVPTLRGRCVACSGLLRPHYSLYGDFLGEETVRFQECQRCGGLHVAALTRGHLALVGVKVSGLVDGEAKTYLDVTLGSNDGEYLKESFHGWLDGNGRLVQVG